MDLLIEQNGTLLPIEIKSGQTLNGSYFDQLTYWNKLTGNIPDNSYVVYGGSTRLTTAPGTFVPYAELEELLSD